MSQKSRLDTAYLVAFDFPLQFEVDGDARLTVDEKAINDTIKLAVFIRPYGIPLYPLGVGVEDYAFDPNDEVLQAQLEVHMTDGIGESVNGIQVEKVFQFDEVENTLKVAVPYLNTRTLKNSRSVVSIPRHKVD